MAETFPCRLGHPHPTAARREDCDARTFDRTGFAKLESVDFAPPPRIVVQEFPGVAALIDGTLPVVVFSAEKILPHEDAC